MNSITSLQLVEIIQRLDTIETLLTPVQPCKAVTVKQATSMYGLTRKALYDLVNSGKVEAGKVTDRRGNTLLIDLQSLDTWYQQSKHA